MDYGREYLRPLLPKGKRRADKSADESIPDDISLRMPKPSALAEKAQDAPRSNPDDEAWEFPNLSRDQSEGQDRYISGRGQDEGESLGQDDMKLPGDESDRLYEFDEFEADETFFDWVGIAGGLDAWNMMVANGVSGIQSHRRHIERAHFIKEAHTPLTLLKVARMPLNFLSGRARELRAWLSKCHQDIQRDHKLVTLCFKTALAVLLLSPICVLGAPYDWLSTIGVWAVVTVDCVFESNVGLAFSKGVNRVIGTFAAGALAVAINHLGPLLGSFHPYFVIICCFVFTALMTFYKYKAPFKDRWNYAVVMSLITFHILVLAGYSSEQEELITVPLSRFAMILLGFLVVTVVNLSIRPAYAGDALHSLVTKNFKTAASILDRCAEEYVKGTVLPHGPDVWAKEPTGEEVTVESLPKLYQAVVQSDVEVDKLLATVPFEPCHGKFFYGYPWHLYDDITDHLRYAVFDIIGLDSCLRAEIQAPMHLRRLITAEMSCISRQCAKVLRALGSSMETHTWVDTSFSLQKAEEAALLLQHKLCKHMPLVLGFTERRSFDPFRASTGGYGLGRAAGGSGDHGQGIGDHRLKVGSAPESNWDFPAGRGDGREGGGTVLGSGGWAGLGRSAPATPANPGRSPSISGSTSPTQPPGVPRGLLGQSGGGGVSTTGVASFPPGEALAGVLETGEGASEEAAGGAAAPSPSEVATPVVGGAPAKRGPMGRAALAKGAAPHGISLRAEGGGEGGEEAAGREVQSSMEAAEGVGGPGKTSRQSSTRTAFIQRQNSLAAQWAGTVERISALSLVKFASLLLEIVAKLKFVVEAMEELALEAHYEGVAGAEPSTEEPPATDVEAPTNLISRS